MTHKSIDALLASTMFLLFTMVTPHYEDVAKKIGFIDSAYAIANTTSYSGTTSSASNSSTNMTVTNTATSTTATTFNFMTTLGATTPVSHPVSGDSRNVELGHFLVINSGPDMQINSMAFTVLGTAPANSLMNINLYDVNGTRIAEQTTDNGSTFYFKYLPIVKSGKDLKVIVKADISSSITSADNGKTIGVAFAAGKATNTSDNTVVDMGKTVNANLMTLSTANISKPSITVLAPNGGENFPVGGKMAVRWSTQNVPTTNDIYLLISNVRLPLGVNDGEEVVVIPSTDTYGYNPIKEGLSTASIRTFNFDTQSEVYDDSDGQIGIKKELKYTSLPCDSTTGPWIKVLSPNGGEAYKSGERVTVKWESCKINGNVSISIDTVFLSKYIKDSLIRVSNTGSYEINMIPKNELFNNESLKYGDYYKILISDGFTKDLSDSTFSIVDPSQKAQGPKASENSDQTTTFTRRLSIGKKGDDVMLLQEILIDQGFLTITNPTGFYGQGTYRGVQKLQKANNIAQTGNVGPATRTLLNSIIAKMDVSGND